MVFISADARDPTSCETLACRNSNKDAEATNVSRRKSLDVINMHIDGGKQRSFLPPDKDGREGKY